MRYGFTPFFPSPGFDHGYDVSNYVDVDPVYGNLSDFGGRRSARSFSSGPALVILSVYLVYPAINTTILSFKDAKGEEFVGLDNFVEIFTESSTLTSMRNSIIWVIVVPFVAVGVGLAFAVLCRQTLQTDRKRSQVSDLHADGHLDGRRQHRVAVRLQLQATGLRCPDRHS